ncbi:MAG: hypothetical protein ACRDPY_13455 [Streptosporangiaceae bacterium]
MAEFSRLNVSDGLGRVDADRLGAPEGGFVARHGVFLLTPVTLGQDESNSGSILLSSAAAWQPGRVARISV